MTHLSELADRVSDKDMALPSDRAGRASPEPASSLGHSATIPSAGADLVRQLRDGKRRIRTLWRTRGLSILLMPRGRRRDYVCAGEKLPRIRLFHFSRNRWGWHFFAFLPNVPVAGAWRICVNRVRASAMSAGTAETVQPAQGQSPASAVPQADAETQSRDTA